MSEISRLQWLCRRGMKELDVVLTRYLETRYPTADDAEQARFRELLQMADPDLYSLLVGRTAPQDAEQGQLLDRLRVSRNQP